MASGRQLVITKPEGAFKAKVLVFGASGLGKTTLLGTANDDERTNPMLLLDFEAGVGSLVGLDIDVVSVRDWKDYNEAYEFLSKGDHPYKSVGIDSISETHTFALMNLLKIRETGTRKIMDLIDQQEYGQALVQMRKLLRQFRNLPMHVFYTALAQDDTEPREGTVKKPDLYGRMANEIQAIMDVCAYLTWARPEGYDEDVRILAIKNYPKIRAKARTPWGVRDIPDEIINPTISDLLTVLRYT